MTTGSLRLTLAAALLTVAVGVLVATLYVAKRTSPAALVSSGRDEAAPVLIFRTLAPSNAFGRVARLTLGRPGDDRQISHLACLRLHYAGGRGLCVTQESDGKDASHAAYVFDRSLTRGPRIALAGVPTRVRVAPDGRLAAITTYAEEESPEGERLAIDSIIVDMSSGRTVADLRQFRIENHDLPPLNPPVDVGGVAFERDGDRFFAAVSTATERYLVSGSIHERRMTPIRTGVASESLSPDGRQLVVKKPGERGFWQLAVIDLRTWKERDLQQGPRSVDDQVEWLDNAHVIYHDVDGDGTALWMLPADGVNGPRVLVKDAYSGAVQR